MPPEAAARPNASAFRMTSRPQRIRVQSDTGLPASLPRNDQRVPAMSDVPPNPPRLSAFRVILLPGIVLPAEPAYGALIEALGPDVEAVAKDLEVYATPEPPQDYSLEVEIERAARGGRAQLGALSSRRVLGRGAASLAFAAARKRLSGVFADFELEVFDDRHHFDPPHRIERERLAISLKKLWGRAERSQPSKP
jgi:hypothetical protein